MSQFRFRLETLRRLREMHRDQMRLRLAEAYEALRIIDDQRTQLARTAAEQADALRELSRQPQLDVARTMDIQRYQLALQAEARTLQQQSEKIAAEAENRRHAVVEADRQVRVLDRLEGRQRAAHVQSQQRTENARLDEAASIGWLRRHSAEGSSAWAG